MCLSQQNQVGQSAARAHRPAASKKTHWPRRCSQAALCKTTSLLPARHRSTPQQQQQSHPAGRQKPACPPPAEQRQPHLKSQGGHLSLSHVCSRAKQPSLHPTSRDNSVQLLLLTKGRPKCRNPLMASQQPSLQQTWQTRPALLLLSWPTHLPPVALPADSLMHPAAPISGPY